MSLEVIDFTERKKSYKLECGEFTLKPPYIHVVNQAEALIRKINEIKTDFSQNLSTKENDTDTDTDTKLSLKVTESKEFKKIIDLYLKLLKLLLEETNEGKLSDLTFDDLRIDIAEVIVTDFFQQFKK